MTNGNVILSKIDLKGNRHYYSITSRKIVFITSKGKNQFVWFDEVGINIEILIDNTFLKVNYDMPLKFFRSFNKAGHDSIIGKN